MNAEEYNAEEYDLVYSDRSHGKVRLTWREVAEELRQQVTQLQRFGCMIADLDRNEYGRHEGDGDVNEAGGISLGNPRLQTGDVLGYDISGRPYVMPERGRRHDPDAWGARP